MIEIYIHRHYYDPSPGVFWSMLSPWTWEAVYRLSIAIEFLVANVPIRDRELTVLVSYLEPSSVMASSLSGKLPCIMPLCYKNNSVLLLSLTFFLLHKQQNVITRMMINNAAAITAMKRIAWHFSQLAQPPSLQQYLHVTVGFPQTFPL